MYGQNVLFLSTGQRWIFCGCSNKKVEQTFQDTEGWESQYKLYRRDRDHWFEHLHRMLSSYQSSIKLKALIKSTTGFTHEFSWINIYGHTDIKTHTPSHSHTHKNVIKGKGTVRFVWV